MRQPGKCTFSVTFSAGVLKVSASMSARYMSFHSRLFSARYCTIALSSGNTLPTCRELKFMRSTIMGVCESSDSGTDMYLRHSVA